MLAQIRGMVPAVNVFLELGRPTDSFGQPPMMMFRLIDILHHTRLENIEQVIECLELINEALAQVRQDGSAKFCEIHATHDWSLHADRFKMDPADFPS